MITIHVEEFMHCRNITKFRKLIRLIRVSDTPECENVIREYMEQELSQFKARQKENAEYIVKYREEVKKCDEELDKHTAYRKRYGRGLTKADRFRLSNQISQIRWRRNEKRTLLRDYQSAFNENDRNERFFRKALGIITEVV